MPSTCPKCDRKFRSNSIGSHAASCGVTQVDLFWQKVEKTDGCWIWTGSRKPRGYGHMRFQDKDYNAHRFSYELHYGSLPADMEVMHICDVPWCVNPAHLKLGTHADNMKDCEQKLRHVYGERNPRARLTADKARAIRARFRKYGPKKTNAKELAAEFGCSRGVVNAIGNGRLWRLA